MSEAVAEGRRTPPDALLVLSGLVLVLLGVPSELIVAPLGAAGTPAQILGILLLLWWLVSRLSPRGPGVEGIGPVKWLLLALALAFMLSYIRGVGEPGSMAERNSADRAVLSLMAWSGILLSVADGLASRERLDRLLRLVAAGVVGIAVLGMVQFFFGIDIAHLFTIPGLSTNHSFGSLVQRSDFRRVSGTTIHPIEFGVVLSMALPLIIHFAIHSKERRWLWWGSAASVAFALPMSVARTAMLGGAVSMLIAFWGWPRRIKLRALLMVPPGLVAMSILVPGLLGTIRGLFLNASTDPSTTGRLEDYDAVWFYFTQDPWTGRGIGTFIPSLYRTLDNQYLGTLVETGLVGLLTLLALLGGGVLTTFVLRERLTGPADRSLASALGAALAVPFVAMVTFDGLAFPMCAGLTFLLLGAVASMWRLDQQQRVPVSQIVTRPPSRWIPWVVAVEVATIGVLVPYVWWVESQSVRYEAYTTVLVDVPRTANGNPYLRVGSADRAASVLQSDLVGPAVRADLDARFPRADYGVSVGYGSLERDSDVIVSSSQLRMRAVAATPEEAVRLRTALLDVAERELTRLQNDAGITDPRLLLVVRVVSQPDVVTETGSRKRALAAAGLVFLLVTGSAAAAVSRDVRGRGQRTTAGDQAPSMSRDGDPEPSAATAHTSVTAASAPLRGSP
ncbi:MAG: O-antigen ligase family protein [Micrococcales bacterium]|nr:O-antigen ligase family protein [Micrococcales bacterium]